MEHQHLSRAIHALQQGTTFAAVLSDGRLVTSEKKGIAPMMELLERDASAMEGASVADRVIGRAAAFLLEKGGRRLCRHTQHPRQRSSGKMRYPLFLWGGNALYHQPCGDGHVPDGGMCAGADGRGGGL